MRRASLLRLTLVFGGALALLGAGVSAAGAAPVRRPHARAVRLLCDAQQTVRRVLRPRAVKSPRRTAHAVVPVRLLVRRHITSWLQRSNSKPFRDGESAAIQSGAAMGVPDTPRLHAALIPLELLASAESARALSRTVATRAPRGPPTVTLV